MKDKTYFDYKQLANDMLYYASCVDNVCCIAYYEDAKNVLKELISDPDTTIEFIQIEDVSYDDYGDAFLVTVDCEGTVFCEKIATKDGEYLGYAADVVLISNDCKHSALKANCEEPQLEIAFDVRHDEIVDSHYLIWKMFAGF